METTGLPITKICDFCNLANPLTNFHRNKTKHDGLSGTCKQCAIERSREQRRPILEANRESRRIARELGPPVVKTCTSCKEEKAISEFHKSSRSWDGHQARCKPCAISVMAEWQRKNPELVRRRNKKWKDENPDQVREANNEWRRRLRRDHPEIATIRERGHALKTMAYSIEKYEAVLVAQGGGCGICGSNNSGKRAFAVDHDHSCCGRDKACMKCVRGLLCIGCNTALHKLERMKDWEKKAMAYLERYASNE